MTHFSPSFESQPFSPTRTCSNHHPAAPSSNEPGRFEYTTAGGVTVQVRRTPVEAEPELARLIRALDTTQGLLLHSGYEMPGRYRRYDIGLVDPPLVVTTQGRTFRVLARHARGLALLTCFHAALTACPSVARLQREGPILRGHVPPSDQDSCEEQRTRRPSVICVLRALVQAMTPTAATARNPLGLYGALGYDLVFQFEDLVLRKPRQADDRELVLYLPDRLLVRDQLHGTAHRYEYAFEFEGHTPDEAVASELLHAFDAPRAPADAVQTSGATPHSTDSSDALHATAPEVTSDHAEGQYPAQVRRALRAFACGDLFELTPSQSFSVQCARKPSALFVELSRTNPAPFAFLANLGQGEFLIGASPEMYVRVRGKHVETCPIAGTIARGNSALVDADRSVELLRCEKSTAELTMCTDVDRNDKARICEPGSVKILARRQLEFYSRLIHTVDHVEGQLRHGYDALDALVTHCWAVTVTGAPKQAAMQFLEDHEASPRRFYGGAVGMVGFDGSLNTGLTLRTVHLREGVATVRAGATLLYDSQPEAEDEECRLKASALIQVLTAKEPSTAKAAPQSPVLAPPRQLTPQRVLLMDHRDSFVHTLADYFRQAGAQVTTQRGVLSEQLLRAHRPDLLVLSPGPGCPRDHALEATLHCALEHHLPVFGVCLGMQGIVEYFGGKLSTLPTPRHGKPSTVNCEPHPLFVGLPERLAVGRYHSLYAEESEMPDALRVIARNADDGCIMAIAHDTLPIAAVQFHPESLMTAAGDHGLRLIRNASLALLGKRPLHAGAA